VSQSHSGGDVGERGSVAHTQYLVAVSWQTDDGLSTAVAHISPAVTPLHAGMFAGRSRIQEFAKSHAVHVHVVAQLHARRPELPRPHIMFGQDFP
jgi:hypothetical protein